jgi:hypothetical protein
MQTSARRGIIYPDLTRGDRPDVPRDIYALVQKVDVDPVYQQGTDAERGASGYFVNGGRFWWTTDTHVLWYDDGNVWWRVSGADLSNTIPLSIIDAKGDLIVGTADNAVTRLPVGTLGQILTVDPGTTQGIKWAGRDMATITQPASLGVSDPPTFTMNVVGVDLTGVIGPGSRINLLQTTQKWFIVTAPVTYAGGNSTITMYGGTDYALLATPGITGLQYSNAKAPPGMPLESTKWSVVVTNNTDMKITNPSQKIWVAPGVSITVPIGSWMLAYACYLKSRYTGGAGEITDYVTLSTTTSTETDKTWTSCIYSGNTANNANRMGATLSKMRPTSVGVKTTYNLLAYPNDPNCSEIGFYGTDSGTVIAAVCSYL